MSRLKTIFNETMMISTAMITGLGVQEMLLHLNRGIQDFEMPWFVPLTIPFIALLCSIPSVLLDHCDALNRKQLICRIFLHFICLLSVVSMCGYVFRWYSNKAEYFTIAGVYVLIYCFVWLASWWLEKKDEEKINEALKDIQDIE